MHICYIVIFITNYLLQNLVFVTQSSGRPLRYLLKDTNIDVLQLRILTNNFKIFKIHMVLNIVTSL
jgi:hypothetical protein